MSAPKPLPDNYCDLKDLGHMQEFHTKVHRGGFRNTSYRYAVQSTISSLLDGDEPIEKGDLYLALWQLIHTSKVDVDTILRYLKEEFATGYDACIIYANDEGSDIFDQEGLNKLNRVIDDLEQNRGKYSQFVIAYEEDRKVKSLNGLPIKETPEATANYIVNILRLLRQPNTQKSPKDIKILDIILT